MSAAQVDVIVLVVLSIGAMLAGCWALDALTDAVTSRGRNATGNGGAP